MAYLTTSQFTQISIISLFFFLDLMATYFFMISYRKMKPKDKKWYELELNFLLRNCWKKWDIHKGTLIGAVFVYPVIFAVAYFIDNQFAFGLIIGVYILVFVIHITNFRILLISNKKRKKKKK